METYLYTALFAPLVGSLFAALFADKPKNLVTGIATSTLLFVSWISSVVLLLHVTHGEAVHVKMMDWIHAGNLVIPFGFVVDQVTAIMMFVVTTVSTVVHVYSIGYMDHDKSFNRFFAWLSAFVFWAANEAFIMNRIADLGMLIGIFLVYWNFGSLQYDVVFGQVADKDHALLMMITAFLFIGAMGKSAQFPLHTWLADAMEGPTPVSALIHAATMVTAGVYLVIRANPLYSVVPEVSLFVASLGAFVAIFAASMALVNRDLKRIIAYSTLSQLGYMFVAAGIGAYWVALFHLMTHAFFKALLFLGAGNVMHAMDDELDIFKMGGLAKKMQWTMILMTIASVALAGIYPLAGFFSKDKILEAAFAGDHYILWTVLWVTAGLTAFYSFRLVMLVFFGEERYKIFGYHPHEAYKYMLWAMAPLAVLAVIAGFFEHDFVHVVGYVLPIEEFHVSTATFWTLIVVTQAIALTGIGVAVFKYSKGGFSKKWEETFIYKLLFNQYYIPKIYDEYICKPYAELSKIFWKELDLKVVDATVDFIATTIYKSGMVSRVVQSGNLSNMLRWMGVGLVILLLAAIIYSPVR